MRIDDLSNLVITKVHSVSTIYTPENKIAKRQDRALWALVIKFEGETVYTASDGKQILSDINHLVLLPRGCSYSWHCTKAGHFSIIEFESAMIGDRPIQFSVKSGEKLLKMFQELEYKRNLKKPMTEVESIRDAYNILLTLTQSHADTYLPADKLKKIEPAIEYISQNYNKSISNDALAALTGMSTVYFRKLFTEIMGTSPITYVHELRIQKAKEMLKSDYGTLSDMAISLGYPSLYDFSRAFKKHTGVSPSRY